ncbi:MAG: transposase [Coprococcus sp.]
MGKIVNEKSDKKSSKAVPWKKMLNNDTDMQLLLFNIITGGGTVGGIISFIASLIIKTPLIQDVAILTALAVLGICIYLANAKKMVRQSDMYPLYWTTSKEGIFMRYSYEFKMMCVELYHSGSYPDIPEGLNPNTLKRHIREWSRLVDLHGPEVLKHKVFNKVWTPEEKLELISKVIAGTPRTKVAIEAGINAGLLYQWVHKYKLQGYNGLVESKKGRPTKEPRMKKSTNPLPLTESEREELIRLRTENEYIKAENEVIKKRIALRQEKWVAQLKAKKQQSSKNSEKKDIN